MNEVDAEGGGDPHRLRVGMGGRQCPAWESNSTGRVVF